MSALIGIFRLVLYGAILIAFVLLFKYFAFAIEGEKAAKILVSVSFLSGSIQSVNFWVIRKINEIQIHDIGFWARWRLRARVEERRSAAESRTYVGVICALSTGFGGAWMYTKGTTIIHYWVLGIASGLIFISVVMLFLTLYEYFVLYRLEAEVNWQSINKEKQQKALESINENKANK